LRNSSKKKLSEKKEAEIGRKRSIQKLMATTPILILRALLLSLVLMCPTPSVMFLPLWSLFKKRVRVK